MRQVLLECHQGADARLRYYVWKGSLGKSCFSALRLMSASQWRERHQGMKSSTIWCTCAGCCETQTHIYVTGFVLKAAAKIVYISPQLRALFLR